MTLLAMLQSVGDAELLKPISAIGLAGFIFWFYRQDRRESEARYHSIATDFRLIVQENTAAVTRLIEALDRERPP